MTYWSEGTTKQYAPHLRTGFSFCSENRLQPLYADVASGAEFLTRNFRNLVLGILQLTQLVQRYHLFSPSVVNGFTFGEQPLIKRLLRGMFKERPTSPRYIVTYHVKYVLY